MQSPSPIDSTPSPIPSQVPVPWWRVGVMWLVVGGLGLVVIGSVAMLVTALRHPDASVPQATIRVGVPNTPDAPALQARNHSATPRP